MHETAKFSGIFTLVQAEFEFEIAMFFHNPPLTPPAKTVWLVGSFGSNITALVLPPTFVGPLSTHKLSTASPGTLSARMVFFLSAAKFFLIAAIFSGVGRPKVGLMVNSHSLS